MNVRLSASVVLATMLQVLAIIAGGASLDSALLMANGVVPFMESVTGFGVSLIIGLPLTLAFGFTAYQAALLTLMGILIGPWGSMGPGTLLGAELAGETLTDLGVATAVTVSVLGVSVLGYHGVLPTSRTRTALNRWRLLDASHNRR